MISDLPPEFGVDVPLQNEAITFSTLDHLLRTPLLVTSAGWNGDLCARLVRYLGIGADRGLHMIFVDAGGAVLAALERLYIATPGHASRMGDLHLYIATLLRSASPTSADKPMTGAYRALSRREAGILRMIAQGQSNKHIAQSLGIAPETVKSHTKSIFIKLETRTRAQAVARAESIGLL